MLSYETEEDLSQPFTQAAESIVSLKDKLTQEEMLILYGLYKQTLLGNNTTPLPSIIAQKDRHKWQAWSSNRGKLKRVARDEYVALANTLITTRGRGCGKVDNPTSF